MEQKQLQNTNQEIAKHNEEYFSFVKKSVADGQYFKDSLDWYLFRYVNPLCDRTLMFFFAIIASISLFYLVQIISNTFPLVEEVPVVIRDYDTSTYRPIIKELKQKNDTSVKNVDEAIARYLLKNYVSDRESYDFRASDVSEVNIKFNRVKNNSSYAEYKNFQLFMSRENPSSPINNFGRNIYRNVEIKSFEFERDAPKNQYERLKWFFNGRMPSEAQIQFTTITHELDDNNGEEKLTKENYLAKIRFNFTGVDRQEKTGILNFVVGEYKLYKVK